MRKIYDTSLGAGALFLAGFFIMPALFFNPSTEYRVIQFLFFLFLAWLSGKRINFLFTIFITVFIVFFNLLIPYGRVLFSAGAFKITSGALEAGIHRAVTLQALVMLSKITVRHDLKLPGGFGQLLGESMRIFSVLINRKYRLFTKDIFNEVDNLMLELSEDVIPEVQIQKIKTKPAGYAILVIIIGLSWLPWLFIYSC
jgi:heptaprenyl diphosphate synthase